MRKKTSKSERKKFEKWIIHKVKDEVGVLEPFMVLRLLSLGRKGKKMLAVVEEMLAFLKEKEHREKALEFEDKLESILFEK